MTSAIGLFYPSLNMTSNSPAAAGYRLENGVLKIDGAANEQIEATANFVRCTTARTISFSYDHNGLRTQKKIVEGSTTTIYAYTLHGKLITHLTKTVNGTKSDEMHFFYDAQGRPAMVKHGNNLYRYVHNLQGDIVGIIDDAGTLVVKCKYDVRDKVLSTTGAMVDTPGKRNPFRYHSYVYDEETGLYYLQERFYNPIIGRFVIVDSFGGSVGGLLSHNTYAYCENDPVPLSDDEGTLPSWLKKVAIGVAVIAACAVVTVATGGAGAGVAGYIAAGALKGAVIGAVSGAATSAAVSAVSLTMQRMAP